MRHFTHSLSHTHTHTQVEVVLHYHVPKVPSIYVHRCGRTARGNTERGKIACSTLQHAAIHCNTLQHTATHHHICLQSTSIVVAAQHEVICTHTHIRKRKRELPATHCNALQHTATHCGTLQHTATFAFNLRPSSWPRSTW